MIGHPEKPALEEGAYTLYQLREPPHTYLLRARRSGSTCRVLWSFESEWGVYARPDGNVTGMHFFADEVQVVDEFLNIS